MVTMSDVAKEARVSRATASYALRGDTRIAESTRNKVVEAARKLNYTANLSARSLRSGKSGIIGVAIFELDKPYPSQMSATLSRKINAYGMQAIIQQTSISKRNEISILQRVTSQLCDGTIFSPGSISNEEMRALTDGKPMVLLDDPSLHPAFDSVMTAGTAGARTAVMHLISIGCRRIIVIGASLSTMNDPANANTTKTLRLRGCLQAFQEAELAFDDTTFINADHWDPDTARNIAHQLIDSGRQFDGAFCMTDSLALGFMRGLADRQVYVPQDAALVGFDGIKEGGLSLPSLTTVQTDLDDLAAKSVGMLMERINQPQAHLEPQQMTANYKLVVRESSRR
ncbi:LacI family transcriptional regulator [Bifidobacterium actinocoloniiforme DSM 22766]|uniref:LacI family transcriptional regulator n=1 Tax=Bifidobacterium actinocoloniiforme DSM 22766 TaxID=1437605 RepID=A0A086YYE6_9BIFI|nr:LacI family DNA-binding transcriptional regulator [Bifidobacterium actinocoloniiforme]AKV55849.1 hypothetical protein AB656_06465 [Bifidobacterium actinocoloniiforme DSM 22766]KFI39296.1 LacI family transcriptional regulator [Bifidobacterium actinocoloniiforme DSM 22766]